MTEHVKMLKDAQTNYYKLPRPILDEGQIEELERSLLESYENDLLIEITTWKSGFFTSRVGIVTKIDAMNKKIILKDEHDSSINIEFFDITKIITK